MTTKAIKFIGTAAIMMGIASLALPAQGQSFGDLAGALTKKKESSLDWGSVSGESDTALINLYQGQGKLSAAVADLADVVSLSEQAAELRAGAIAVEACGASSCPEYSEVTAQDAQVQEQVLRELEAQAGSLSTEQKEKAGDALQKYVLGGIQFAKGVSDAKRLGQLAADAPMLQKPKFIGLIKAVPTAAKGVGNLVQTAPKLFRLASAADIKEPEGADAMMGAL
ncbi:hypothetical protein IDSA_08905 [Pseudidiomarina salinarum]|uniref:DUF4197 domain-containing protein n=1 Tax=Pseudidiomarina salinarum TaxID=435908 RepID=A0A094JDJ9_9GAMM|nr:hypothetical protein [Pseudidiomarina salinarum]KFZ30641.1 hypothetical protein IDSA_08905 [Pseudidiomarina salinarum]RUO69152.1 hypothetical protein CWI79_09595 [Pseudidiomarina salinarum]